MYFSFTGGHSIEINHECKTTLIKNAMGLEHYIEYFCSSFFNVITSNEF